MRLFFMALVLTASCAFAAEPVTTRTVDHVGDRYTLVTVHLDDDADLRLYGGRAGGITLDEARTAARKDGRTAVTLTNGGMYGPDNGPVGLFVTNGSELHSIAVGGGDGNFYMKPNGVFWVDTAGVAHVTETSAFPADHSKVFLATQSGPMLLVDGAVHPSFRKASPNRLVRSGVGVSVDGKTVYIAISQGPVRFYDFATLFRDNLHCKDALFLDGVVSKLWTEGDVPDARYGSVIAVTRKL